MTIHSTISGQSIPELEEYFSGKGYGDLKSSVAEVVVDFLNPVRVRVNELLAEPAYLHSVLKLGAEKAEVVANQTLKQTYEALGLVPRD